MDFTRDEMMLMMLYSPGTRQGLIDELGEMRSRLLPSERKLNRLSKSVIGKLNSMTDGEFENLELYPDFDPPV